MGQQTGRSVSSVWQGLPSISPTTAGVSIYIAPSRRHSKTYFPLMSSLATDAVPDRSTYRNICTMILLVIGRCHWKLFSTVPIEVAEQNTSANIVRKPDGDSQESALT
jgi:hypothetical protein